MDNCARDCVQSIVKILLKTRGRQNALWLPLPFPRSVACMRYRYHPSPIGQLLLAGDEQGLHLLHLGQSPL